MSYNNLLDLDNQHPVLNTKVLHETGNRASNNTHIHLDNTYSQFVVPATVYSGDRDQSYPYYSQQQNIGPLSTSNPNQWPPLQHEENQQSSSSRVPLQTTPTRKRKKTVDLREELQKSIKKGKIDILAAGTAIQNAYEANQAGIPDDVASFLSSNVNEVSVPKIPDQMLNLESSSFSSQAMSIIHGYGVVSQLALLTANKALTEARGLKSSGDDLNLVSDAPHAVKAKFNFPSAPPFSGKEIDLKSLDLLHSSTPAHVRLQKYLYEILGKSCTNQTDVQRFWILPGEKKFNYSNPSPFPKELFDNLRQLFLEFFQLDYTELDEPTYKDEYANLHLLKNYGTVDNKKRKFTQMVVAKKAFLSTTFRTQFKNALKELRLATFVIADGSSEGFFSRRKRDGSKKSKTKVRKNRVEEEEEEEDGEEMEDDNVINICD